MSIEMVPTTKDLLSVMDQVWLAYIDPDGVDMLRPAEDLAAATELHAWVAITGAWQGQVVVTCSATLARNLAAAFLAMGADEVTEEDVADVLGELANIVGGNVKSLLPSGCALSTPYYVGRGEVPFRQAPDDCVVELVGVWMDEVLSVGLWQSGSAATQAPA